MPQPSSALVTLRPDLAQSFMQFDLEMARQGFIAQLVCPVMDVAKASGNFGIIPIEQLLQNRDTQRAPGSGYQRGKYTFKPATFATAEHGAEEPVDDNEAELYRSYFDVEQIAAARALDAVLRGLEQRVAALYFSTATFTGALTVAAASTYLKANWATATPIDDVETAVQQVWANSGLWPTSLILDRHVYRNMRNCQQIIDRVKYSGFINPTAKDITPNVLAEVFDLQEVIVAGEGQNSADEGQAASISTIWDKTKMMVARIDRSKDFRRPTVGRCFHWGDDGSTIGGTIESYRDEPKRSDVIRVRNQTGEQIIYPQAAVLVTGVG